MKINNAYIFNFVHTTRVCQALSSTLKYKRLDSQIRKKTKEPKQDQIWLKSLEFWNGTLADFGRLSTCVISLPAMFFLTILCH
jgi:hypothetical protein